MKLLHGMMVLVLLTAGSLYLQAQESAPGSPGGFTKDSGRSIYYSKKGAGNPHVIFVSGLGEDHQTWKMVQDSVSLFSTTISYDRSGLGKSADNDQVKDLQSLAAELKYLVKALKISKPFILVGHSLGCQIIKQYAVLHPADIYGVVFIDPGYNEQKLRKRLPDSVWNKREQTLKKYMPVFNKAQQKELDNRDVICRDADRITSLPGVPVVLMTATLTNPNFPGSATELEVKKESHRLWVSQLPGARQVEVAGSRHYIHSDLPGLVISAIHSIILNK